MVTRYCDEIPVLRRLPTSYEREERARLEVARATTWCVLAGGLLLAAVAALR